MSKFRIKVARQCGEKIARDHGCTTLPIDIQSISKQNEIQIIPKPPDVTGVSGGIIFHPDDSIEIFYATNIDNNGFQRFTLAHELGHFFLPGHPEEILSSSPFHVSRAGFSQGDNSIEIEADHFASGLLMPTTLVRQKLRSSVVGLDGIIDLSDRAETSLTSAAIRAAECIERPLAVVVSRGTEIAYSFLSESFRALRPGSFLRKGDAIPQSATRTFNEDAARIRSADRTVAESSLGAWFGTDRHVPLDEEIIGLGRYGHTLTVLSSDELSEDPDEELDEEADLEASWTPRFARGR